MPHILAYPARFARPGGGETVVTFRDVPEALTGATDDGGEDIDALAADALAEAVAACLADGELPSPPSKARKGERLVPLEGTVALKLLLHVAMATKGVTKVALARALDVDEAEARRILNPHHATRPKRLQAALRAVGTRTGVAVFDVPAATANAPADAVAFARALQAA